MFIVHVYSFRLFQSSRQIMARYKEKFDSGFKIYNEGKTSASSWDGVPCGRLILILRTIEKSLLPSIR